MVQPYLHNFYSFWKRVLLHFFRLGTVTGVHYIGGASSTAQKMKFFTKDLFSKCD